jgi:hypothetical protein
MFLGIVLLVGYSVAIYEWFAGSGQALIVYWVTNTVGLLLAAVVFVWPLYRAGSPMGQEVAQLSDVGPSAGGLGCIGGWVGCLPQRYRRWLFAIVLTYLGAKLAFLPELFADSAHLIAFALGFFLARRPLFGGPEVARPSVAGYTGGQDEV